MIDMWREMIKQHKITLKDISRINTQLLLKSTRLDMNKKERLRNFSGELMRANTFAKCKSFTKRHLKRRHRTRNNKFNSQTTDIAVLEMDGGKDEGSDLNPEDPQHESSDSDDEDRFYFVRLKIMSNLKRHRLALHRDEKALNCEINSLRQSLNRSSGLVEELQDGHQVCVEKGDTIKDQNNAIIKLNEENQALKARYENIDSEKLTTTDDLQSLTETYLMTIQELRTKQKDLEVQLEEAMAFGGPNVDQSGELGQRPHSHVEVSEVEDTVEKRQDPRLDVQTKSWWRQQADKAVKGMGTFRQLFKGCFRVRTRKRRVVQPVNGTIHIGMPDVSDGMPPVSI